MKTNSIRERVLDNLGKFHYSADMYQIFSSEQKKFNRRFQKFWKRLQTEDKLLKDIIFKKHLHLKLASPTFESLKYAFSKVYFNRTDNELLKNYTNALMGYYEFGYEKFGTIIRQRELALVEYILSDIKCSEMCEDRRTQVFMRQAMTLLVLNSEMKYDTETEAAIDMMLDEFEEGRAAL